MRTVVAAVLFIDTDFHTTELLRGVRSGGATTPGFDNFVAIDGTPLQHGSRKNLRPFNGEELQRILRVGLCLDCHTTPDDPAYREYDWKKPCPVFREP